MISPSPTLDLLICALIGGNQPINGCGPLSRCATIKDRVGAKGTVTTLLENGLLVPVPVTGTKWPALT